MGLKHRLAALAFFIALPVWMYSEVKGSFSGSLTVFGGDSTSSASPMTLSSERGWTLLGAVNLDALPFPESSEGFSRSWRLRTVYEHAMAKGPTTLQVRFSGFEIEPTFTHPWSEGADRHMETYSNWYHSSQGELPESGKGYLEVRLIAPPRTPTNGKIFTVVLEAWDIPKNSPSKAGQNVHLAAVSPSSVIRFRANPDGGTGVFRKAEALNFALAFVESCIIGDLPQYYRAHAEQVRSLDDGGAKPKYRMRPPRGISGVRDLETYKRHYSYHIYGPEEYASLFPEWFLPERPWTPDEHHYLFMGHQGGDGNAEGVDYLVFMVAPDEKGNWVVVARPGT